MPAPIAIVTGANRGIGFGICQQLGKAGFHLILTARNEEKGRYATQQLKKQHCEVDFFLLDVANHDSIQAFAEQMNARFEKIDVLINNAGILLNGKNTLQVSPAEMKMTLDVNFFGPLFLSQAMVPLLKNSKSGRIINISSGMGALAEMGAGYAAYRLSKTALNGLTRNMAMDLNGTPIQVVAMCPGWVKTGMGGAGAPRSVAEGADTAFWLATTDQIVSGTFYRDRKPTDW